MKAVITLPIHMTLVEGGESPGASLDLPLLLKR